MSTINVEYKGSKYTLGFTRATVSQMEKTGFRLNDISDKPVTSLPALFQGAFIAHHRFVKTQTIMEIFDAIADRDKLFSTLVDMYNETVLTIMTDPGDGEGNATWEASV